MSELEGNVYVREDVLYYDRDWVHLVDNEGYRVEPQDAALLELVLRGEGDFRSLCKRVAELAPHSDPAALTAGLAHNLRDPRSILVLRAPVSVVAPDVIVCDFSGEMALAQGAALVRSLRRDKSVLHLGLDGRVRGPLDRNLSLKASMKAGFHRSWFEFAQWCRAQIRKSTRALLVLCGPQDAILFGDLVAHLRSMVVLDPSWPSRTGVGDLLGPDWIPSDPFPALRGLFYALRFSPPESLHEVRRAAASDFAILEGFALKHAERVAYGMLDQRDELERFGRSPESNVIAHGFPLPSSQRKLPKVEKPSLLIVASLERKLEPLAPLLAVLRAIPVAERRFEDLVLATPEGWFKVEMSEGVIKVTAVDRRGPSSSNTIAAIAIPGVLRGLQVAFEVQARGIPMLYVPAIRAHPLLDEALPEAILARTTPVTLTAMLTRLLDPADALADRILRHQADRLKALALPKEVRRLLQAPARLARAPED